MQLQLIQALQQIRCSFIDHFFIGLNFFDTGAFYFLLIPALWFGKSWKTGLKLFSLILLSTFAVQKLKILFGLPRPFQLIESLGVIHVSGNGFPSGGATNAMLLSCLLLTYGKIRFKKTLALLYVFFVSLSRIYLGVHFITDVLGGWVLGLSLWALFVLTIAPIQKWLEKSSRFFLFFVSQAYPLCLLLLHPKMHNLCLIAMGLNLSLFIQRPQPTKGARESLIKGGLGALISFLVYLIVHYFFHPKAFFPKAALSFVIGFGIGISGSYLCKKLPIKKRKS